MKDILIKLNVKKQWEIGRGHIPHRSGSGKHDNRPKRLRTRRSQNEAAIRDN